MCLCQRIKNMTFDEVGRNYETQIISDHFLFKIMRKALSIIMKKKLLYDYFGKVSFFEPSTRWSITIERKLSND